LKRAYNDTDGSLDEIMNHIPHSTIEDEPRFVRLVTNLIKSGDLTSTPTWEKSVKDETARLKRKKKSAKEAEEAEALAKEIGVWDEFYGSGKPTDKATKKQKGKRKADAATREEDVSALQALILKRKKNMDGFFDSLAAKYAEPEPSARSGGSRGKKRKADVDEDPPAKKSKTVPPPPDIDDEEFARIQESLLKKKAPTPSKPGRTSKGETKRKDKAVTPLGCVEAFRCSAFVHCKISILLNSSILKNEAGV
jgi:DnaJ family protein C protein 9